MVSGSVLSSLRGTCSAWQALFRSHAGPQLLFASTALSQGRGYASATSSSTESSSSSSSSNQEAGQQTQTQWPPLYAACVLERLPIVKSPPPEWEASYKAWLQLHQLQHHQLKQYPLLDAKQRDAAGSKDAPSAAAEAPSTTAADTSGAVNTMKRRLPAKLVLLVKAKHNALTTAAAAAGGSPSGAAVSSSWTFPHTRHQPGETIRQAAERALKEAIGPSQVYFIGNAPMAHLDIHNSSSSGGGSSDTSHPVEESSSSTASQQQEQGEVPLGRVFFHLAQVVNDPWDVELVDAAATDFAWVAKDELQQYIQDEQLLKLACDMV